MRVMWRLEYPLTLLIVYFAFFICSNKKKRFYIPLIVGILAMFGYWQIQGINKIIVENVFLATPFYLLEITILAAMVYFTLDIGLSSSIFLTINIVSLQHVCYKGSLQIVNFIDMELYHSPYYFIIDYAFTIVFAVIIYFTYSRKLIEYISYASVAANTVAFAVFVAIELVFSFYQSKLKFLDNPNRMLINSLFNFSNIIISILLISSLYTFVILQKRKQEALIISLMAQKERERFELSKITMDEINIKYHDLKHMLQDNNNSINEDDLKEIKETVTNYKAIIQTSNAGLNVVVYENQLKCIKLGIDLNVLIDGDTFTDFKPHHIYSLLSNLLDNAIEAVEPIKEKNKRRVSLKIKTVRESIILSIENYFDIPPKMFNGVPISLKNSTKHGYGLKSVKRITDIYDGVIDYSIKDDKFIVTIIFPKKKEENE